MYDMPSIHILIHAGINETGIFRLPGQSSRVQALKDTYDCGKSFQY